MVDIPTASTPARVATVSSDSFEEVSPIVSEYPGIGRLDG